MNNHVDYQKKWFHVSDIEQKLYKKLNVKKWKGNMGTYDPDCFDSKRHSWDEIVQATCQAELVHELIIIFSFIPIFAANFFGALPVFVITSVLAACFDAMFVIIQRYNRPRILKLMNHSKKILYETKKFIVDRYYLWQGQMLLSFFIIQYIISSTY